MELETMQALCNGGRYAAIGLSAIGSAIGIGMAGMAAIGAMKKLYAQNKPAPFMLVAFTGCPISQTLYGLITISFADLRWALLPCSRARRLPAHAMRSRKLEKE